MRPESRENILHFERLAQGMLGISEDVLMERAGAAVAQRVLTMLNERNLDRVGFICGPGKNGGDGLVAANLLAGGGFDMKAFLLSTSVRPHALFNAQIQLSNQPNLIVEHIQTEELLRRFAQSGELLWIDAIFGIGLSRRVEGLPLHCIEFLNESKQAILAVDIPSGVEADTGEILGGAIRATTTLTFLAPKVGLTVGDGPLCTGELKLDLLGIPAETIQTWSIDLEKR